MVKLQNIAGTGWKKSFVLPKKDSQRKIFGYGMELTLNLYDCDLKKLNSKKQIQKFVITLCDDVIQMKRFGKPLIPNFGHDNPTTSGFSLVQLIETSSVTGHFSESQRSCYLNIFSCAPFNPQKTAEFCQKFFAARYVDAFLISRP